MSTMSQAEIDNIMLDLHLAHTPAQKAAWADKHGHDLCIGAVTLAIEVGTLEDRVADEDDMRGTISRASELGEIIQEELKRVGSALNSLEDTIRREVFPYEELRKISTAADDLVDLK